MVGKVKVCMGDNSVKNSRIKILKSHAHIHIIGRKSTKFQVNPMKDAAGVVETSSLGRTDVRMGRRNNAHTHGRGHFYSPPPPMSGDNMNSMKCCLDCQGGYRSLLFSCLHPQLIAIALSKWSVNLIPHFLADLDLLSG